LTVEGRRLKFDGAEQAAILRKLGSRAAGSDAALTFAGGTPVSLNPKGHYAVYAGRRK
jgi:hypothetical protein